MNGASGDGSRRLLLGGGVLGFGLGGLLDVIVFHHILQSHHLVSSRVDPASVQGLRTNLLFDGAFSLAFVGIACIGGAIAWRSANRAERPLSGSGLLGSALVGAGAFNVLDGVVDHYVLDLHDAVHGTAAWNLPWIALSVVLLAAGVAVLRRVE